MKKTIKYIILTQAVSLLIASCATTSTATKVQSQSEVIEISEDEETSSERKEEKREAKPLSVKTKTNQQETEFIKKLSDIDIKLLSSPKPIFQTQNFKTPYTVLVEDSNGPVSDFDITVSFPSSKTKDSVIYETVQLKTDSEGKISFKPKTPEFALKDKVTFYPSPVNSTQAMVNASYDLAVTAPYLVKSSNLWYQGILYVYDFNENGKPTSNSTQLLTTLRNSGVNVGNAPISSTSYYDKPMSQLYKDCFAIVGNSCRFLVAGSIKFAEPVKETENGFTCTLNADISCFNMKNGEELCAFQITETVSNLNRYKAISECKNLLAEKIAEEIMYGM